MTESSIDVPLWPCALSDNLKQQLLNIAQPCQGIPNIQKHRGLYYIGTGLFIIHYATQHMNNNLGYAVGADDWIGASKIVCSDRFFLQAIELEPVESLFFPHHKISKLAEINHEVYKLLYFCLANVQPVHLQGQLTAMQDKEVRVVYTLFSLAQKKISIEGARISLKITQEQLSLVTGLSRPRINEILKKIEKSQEISITRGSICILDIIALGKRLDHALLMFNDPRIKS